MFHETDAGKGREKGEGEVGGGGGTEQEKPIKPGQ